MVLIEVDCKWSMHNGLILGFWQLLWNEEHSVFVSQQTAASPDKVLSLMRQRFLYGGSAQACF